MQRFVPGCVTFYKIDYETTEKCNQLVFFFLLRANLEIVFLQTRNRFWRYIELSAFTYRFMPASV